MFVELPWITLFVLGADSLLERDKKGSQGGVCPEMCSRRVGNRCIFTDAQMFDHCPWGANRNFNSFGNALLQLFFITTGDNNWISILINGMRSNESIAAGLIFFVIFFFISYAFLYSLLIVVIIMAFDLEMEAFLE